MEKIGVVNISRESVIEWKIPEFLSLSDKVDTYYDSFTFFFAGASWFIRIYPNGLTKALRGKKYINTEGYVDVFLWRDSSGSPINLEVNFELKTDDKGMGSFSYSYSFENKENCGTVWLIKRDMLLKSWQTSSSTLAVICKLKYLKSLQNSDEITETTIDPKDKILQDLKDLIVNLQNCDVVLKVKQQEFSAHKAILTARSPVFASTFQHDMKEKATGIVNIDDCEPSIFSIFLEFLYCGEVKSFSKENVYELFAVSDKYDVPDLKLKCIEFIKTNLSVETFCDTINLALKYSETALMKFTTSFFIKNAKKIIVTADWQRFAKENPTQSNELFIKFVALV